MDHLEILEEVFPHMSEEQILDIIMIVEQGNPNGSADQRLNQICDMLSGDKMPANVPDNPQPVQVNIQGEIQENALQGQAENPDDERLLGAVGFGHAVPVSTANLNEYFNNLQSIFPDAAPEYLWNFCQRKGAAFELGAAIDEISRDGYDRIVFDSNAIWERLQEALPMCDPSYLEKQAQRLALEDRKNLEDFVSAAIENNDYPTMEQYLKRKKEKEKINSFKEENFHLEIFLESFPDPEAHFRDPNRPNPLDQENLPEEDLLYAKTFLYNKYPDIRKRHVDLVFRQKKMRLIDCCEALDTIKAGMKIKRGDETMPDSKNLALLQEVIYLKCRRLIRRLLKYKDETYRTFKDQARALGLLKTCGVCAEDELIPEECFGCQKDCVFCKDCVKRYVEVKMGDGLYTFPCCGNCDSQFSLHILQMALPQHMFERLILKIQSEEIKQANVEGLETCPFCDFASIPPDGATIFKCENAECLKESCRLCRHESHIPLKCNEIEYDEDVRRRTYIENMMTEALARTCHSCKKKFVKSNGCNKMICNCGAIMCYQCSQPITGYNHFNGNPCALFTNDAQIDLGRVRARAEQAKHELGNVEIKFDPAVGIENFFEA